MPREYLPAESESLRIPHLMNRRSFISLLTVAPFVAEAVVSAVTDVLEISDKLIFVNVGFGDTSVLHLGGQVVMIDCYQEPGYGESFMRYLPGGHVDLLLLTHRHFDHYWGIETLLRENVSVTEVWESAYIGDQSPDYVRESKFARDNGTRARYLVEQLRLRGTKVRQVSAVESPREISGFKLEILHPTAEHLANRQSTLHDNCLVARLSSRDGRARVLFCGDASLWALDRVFRECHIEPVSVYCSSHHGGLDSIHAPLLAKANPLYSIISSRPGFHPTIPEPEALAVYRRYTRKAVCRTYEQGSIILELGDLVSPDTTAASTG